MFEIIIIGGLIAVAVAISKLFEIAKTLGSIDKHISTISESESSFDLKDIRENVDLIANRPKPQSWTE